MLVLGINCAGNGCDAALVRDGAVLAQQARAMTRGQDAQLLPLIADVLDQAGCAPDALDRVAVTRGPGSFTGLRIGLAAARGFAMGCGIPVMGIDRFALYRAATGAALIALDSRRAEMFCWMEDAAFLATPADLLGRYGDKICDISGDGNALLAASGAWAGHFVALDAPESVWAARLGAEAVADDPAFRAIPLYLRAPDVSCGPVPATEEA